MKNKIEFTEEQAMLLEAAQNFCEKESPLSSVRNQFLVENRFDEKRWDAMAELGWLSITIPEDFGGLGLSLSSVVPVIENMGRQLMSSPFLATSLATQAIVLNASDVQKQAWLPKNSYRHDYKLGFARRIRRLELRSFRVRCRIE